MDAKELKVGQTLYSYDLREFIVSKIAKKYFECENHRGKFVIETLKYYSPEYTQAIFQLYIDKQFILDTRERKRLESELRNKIGVYGSTSLSLEQLRTICLIIE